MRKVLAAAYERTEEEQAAQAREVFGWTYEMESLRNVLLHELATQIGQRRLAAEIGVSRGTLRKLLEMRSTPTPPNLERLTSWAENRPKVTPVMGAVALALLAWELPAEARLRGRRQMAEELAQAYLRAGERVPAWLCAELPPDSSAAS